MSFEDLYSVHIKKLYTESPKDWLGQLYVLNNVSWDYNI